MAMLKQVLKQLGIEPQRLRLDWVSASEGERFATLVNEMTKEIIDLGPLSSAHVMHTIPEELKVI